MFFMLSEKPILNIALDEELLERLDDFRFENRINSRSEAIRRLLEEALRKYKKKQPKKGPPGGEDTMSDKDSKVCPSCGAKAEFIQTCADCGHIYCPWCRIRHVDTHKVFIPKDIASCPKCGSDKFSM